MLLLRNSTKTTTRLVLPYEIRVHNTAQRDEQMARLVAETFCLKDFHQLRIQPLTGGLSNSLFVAYHQQQPVVLIRVHPDAPSTNSSPLKHAPPFIDHRTETKLLRWLSQQHDLAPKLYGSFQNGRLEEFYPDHKPLASCRDMIVYAPSIAQRMAQLHALSQDIVTISCFERTRQWLALAKSLVLQHDHDEPELASLLHTLQDEWKWIESVFSASTDHSSPAHSFLAQRVLTHGDLQSLNVLVNEKDPTDVRIIDYEYASYSPRGFDLANTFCEYCDMNNLRADYEQEYPTLEEQHNFLRSYLMTTLGHNSVSDVEYVHELAEQVGRYTVVSHISWAIWSIVQHFRSAQRETFDYVQYARHRLEGHAFSKKRFWSQ